MQRLVAASYNVHRCVGRDGVASADRIAQVIDELDADIVALQEVSRVEELKAQLRHEMFFAETMTGYGNALVSRLPMRRRGALNLSVGGREPRGALHVEIVLGGETLHVIAAHLGLRRVERRWQFAEIVRYSESLSPLMVLGDFNEWRWRGAQLLDRAFGRSAALSTWPSRFPFLALDRIWVREMRGAMRFLVHRSALARVASDHLPLRMELDMSKPPRKSPAEKDPTPTDAPSR